MGETKPAMFIGSSVEGKRIAETIQVALEYEVHSTVWHQGVFGLSGGTLESLVEAVGEYDFATLVLTADDMLGKRNITGRGPRDNVLFELGLFMGALGRQRTFIVHSRTTPPLLPTDLAGITPATFEERSNLDAALGPACTKIRRAIESQGLRRSAGNTAADAAELPAIRKMLSDQQSMLSELFQRLTAPRGVPAPDVNGGLDFLEGSWMAAPTGSSYYCSLHDGVPRFVYCYRGDSAATGEYYDLRRVSDEIVGRFRWYESDIRGFIWLKIESPTRLSGAWWMEDDVAISARDDLDRLKKSKGMNTYAWHKREGAVFPTWALAALQRPRAKP